MLEVHALGMNALPLAKMLRLLEHPHGLGLQVLLVDVLVVDAVVAPCVVLAARELGQLLLETRHEHCEVVPADLLALFRFAEEIAVHMDVQAAAPIVVA